jgi:hypothetical protein
MNNIRGLSKFVLRGALQEAIETEIHLHNNTRRVQYCPDFALGFEWDYNPAKKTFKTVVVVVALKDLEDAVNSEEKIFDKFEFEFSYQTVCEWILINAGCYDEVPVSIKRRKK